MISLYFNLFIIISFMQRKQLGCLLLKMSWCRFLPKPMDYTVMIWWLLHYKRVPPTGLFCQKDSKNLCRKSTLMFFCESKLTSVQLLIKIFFPNKENRAIRILKMPSNVAPQEIHTMDTSTSALPVLMNFVSCSGMIHLTTSCFSK